ncbi:putative cell wall binding repeat protein [Kineococcus xinjiangensis]|uniref:Putative cell wall binding repeat protein n=1 Tax=Kineococcus xinjiangensis TaxID=512762 RepID=A0A2S6IPA9_9ACTN|nr:cell wall-binding repeat-containing protein [Kineococcus xinjiangensis]PPK96005.1 putative cell wall binding repeat protein [Kineococcus xinjiangensis]
MSRPTTRPGRRAAAAAVVAAAAVTALAVPADASPIRAHSLFGADRYLTSVVLEDAVATVPDGPVMETAFVVTGQDFPDGLAAGALAGWLQGNIYLSPKGQLTQEVRDRLAYHRNIVLVGSEGVLGPDIMTWLRQNTRANLHRIEGGDRFATAANLALWANETGRYPGGAKHVILATGSNYPDALAGSAVGSKLGAPMLLVTRDGIPAPTALALKALAPERITVLGAESAVSAAVLEQLTAIAPATVQRVHGADRYETAAAAARAFFTAEDTNLAVLVSGHNWADAITAGAYAGRRRAPLLLTPPTCVPQSVNLTIEALDPFALRAVGGPRVLGEDARLRTSCEAGPKTYLDQLPWPTGNARFLSDHATIDGVFYPRSASFDTDPRNSEYRTWNLKGEYSRFTATVGVLDGNTSGLRSTVEVYGDEKLLASRTVAAGAAATFDVPITGVENLKVVSTSSDRTALHSTDNVIYLGDAAVR